MTAARETSRLLLAAWLGAGLLFASSVAPAAFAVLPSRALAGLLVGRVLPVLFFSGAFLATADFVVEQTYQRRERTRLARRLLDAIAVVACLLAQLTIAPRIHALRERIGPSLDALAPTDSLRLEFGRLHALSVGLLGVAMLAIAFSIAIEVLLATRDRALAASSEHV